MSRHPLYLSRSSESDLLDLARERRLYSPTSVSFGTSDIHVINLGLLESFSIYSDL